MAALFQVNANDVGRTDASGVMPNSAGAFQTFGSGASGLIGTVAEAKREKNASAAEAEQREMEDASAIDAVSLEDSVERERALSQEEIAAARATGDQQKIQRALEQAGSRQRATVMAHNRALLARLEYYQQKGMAAAYLRSYTKFTGKDTAALDQAADTTSEAYKEQAEILKRRQVALETAGRVVTGDPTRDTASYMELAALQQEAVDAQREVGVSQNKATLYDAEHGATLKSIMGSFLAEAYYDITQTQDPEQRQQKYEAFKANLADFNSAVNYATSLNKITKSQQASLYNVDSLLSGTYSKYYQTQVETYDKAISEFVTKGLVSADTKAKAERVTNTSQIAVSEWIEKAYPGLGPVVDQLTLRNPQVGNEILAAINKVKQGNPTDNIKAVQQLEKLLSDAKKKSGSGVSKQFEKDLQGMMNSIRMALNSSDNGNTATALNTITKDLWEMLPQGRERSQIVTDVENLVGTVKTSINDILQKHGLDGKLTDYVSLYVTTDGNVVLQPRKGAEFIPPAAQQEIMKPSLIGPAIKAYSIIHGVDLKEAGKIFEQTKEVEAKKEDKTSSLNLPEDRLKFLQGLTDEDWQELMKA